MNMKEILSRLAVLLAAPATAAHEATHALFALPFASGVSVVLKPHTQVLIDWSERTPRAAILVTHFAPLIVGGIIAVATFVWMLVEPRRMPDTRTDWLWLALLGIYWSVYALGNLSQEDRQIPEVVRND